LVQVDIRVGGLVLTMLPQLVRDGAWGPFRLESSVAEGRFLVAAREVKAGELLLETAPDVGVVNESGVNRVCARCFHSDGPVLEVRCGQCEYAYYCSEACKVEASSLHSVECPVLARLRKSQLQLAGRNRNLLTSLRLLVQVLYFRRRTPDETLLRELCDGLAAFRLQPSWLERSRRYQAVAESFAEVCGDDFQWTSEEVFAVLGMADSNVFSLWISKAQHRTGCVLYGVASLLNHSCIPNVARVQRGCRAELFALRDVGEGEPLCLAYANPKMERTVRRRGLSSDYGFDCQCARCIGDEAVLPEMCPWHLGYLIPHEGGAWCSVCAKGEARSESREASARSEKAVISTGHS